MVLHIAKRSQKQQQAREASSEEEKSTSVKQMDHFVPKSRGIGGSWIKKLKNIKHTLTVIIQCDSSVNIFSCETSENPKGLKRGEKKWEKVANTQKQELN